MASIGLLVVVLLLVDRTQGSYRHTTAACFTSSIPGTPRSCLTFNDLMAASQQQCLGKLRVQLSVRCRAYLWHIYEKGLQEE